MSMEQSKLDRRRANESLPPELLDADEPQSAEPLFDEPFQKEKLGWTRRHVIVLVAVAIAAVLGVAALIAFLPRSEGSVKLNEAMSSNDKAYVHPVYGSVDWVELYNPTSHEIDLSGFGLTDDLKKQYKYTFPAGTVLESGAYLVLWCTGGTNETDADPYCTGFALSQEGETLYLIDDRYYELDELKIPPMETDYSYARSDSGTFRATPYVTPGEANRFAA